MKKQKSDFEILKPFIEKMRERVKDGLRFRPKTLERLSKELNTYLKQILNRMNKNASTSFTARLKRAYNSYIKSGYKKNNVGIKGWRLNDLKADMREELRNRIVQSLSLVQNTNANHMAKLTNRFLNWGYAKDANNSKKGLVESLDMGSELAKAKRHQAFVLSDQTRKMICNFDNIVADKYKAIAFEWKTRRDNRVVGTPGGKNPTVTNPKMHGDHYERSNKIYFLHNTWAIQERLIDTKAKDFNWADFEDGLPGQPIGCRCYARYFYDLEDLPENLLTEKGKDFIKG